MSRERRSGADTSFDRLMAIVDGALDRPTGERVAYLEAECEDDDALLRRARSLLKSAEAPVADGLTGRFASVVAAAAADVLGDSSAIPERIGPYTIVGVLGQGGMGTVYAARQEEPIAREVAIKAIRAGAHAPGLVERFRAERQTLATLEHPNIAKLYDAGTSVDGLPYFVMERIRGEPITDYCRRHGLAVAERIRLFRTLLAAVRHAHQKTIVHRDLKPSNVMVAEVDGRPVLKVIDFGIARVASGEPGLTALVGMGGGLGTLEYMSPERLLRLSNGADTSTDIYSLGVILYELIAGALPFDPETLREASPSELERLLLHTPVVRASRRATEAARVADRGEMPDSARAPVRPRNRSDLDTIIDVAMARDPARRYPTVVQLDDDLERLLGGRPITARPRTLGYRTAKFVDRNRVPVAAGVTAIALLLASSVAFTVRLAHERDRAQLEADKAQQIAGMLESFLAVPDPATVEPADMTARELLDIGATRIEHELADQPDVEGALFEVVGRTYAGLGLWDEADEYLTRALDLGRSVEGRRSVEVADRLQALGEMRASAGRFDAAETALRAALALRTELLGADDPATAESMAALSQTRRWFGDYDEAESLARGAVRVLRAAPEPHPLILAQALHALGFTLRAEGSLAEAEIAYREAADLRRRELDPTHPLLVSTLSNLALTLEALGRYEEAERLLRETLEARRARLGGEHPSTLTSLNNLAYMLWRTGQYARATALFEEGAAIGARTYPEDNATYAIMLNNLGVAQRRVGALEESEATHRRALAMNRRLFGDVHPRVAADMDNLGRTLVALGRPAEAVTLHRRALAMRTELLGEDHPDRAESIDALGLARLAQGDTEEGLGLLEEAVAVRTERLGSDNPRTAESMFDLGRARLESGDLPGAETALRRALAVRRSALGDDHPDVASTLVELGRVLVRTGRADEADGVLTEAADIVRSRLGPDDPVRGRIEANLVELRAREGAG